MNTTTVMNTMVMNKPERKVSLVERLKKYFKDNAVYFIAGAAMISGNNYVATQVMKDLRR